jgi:uridine kinase
MGRPNFLADTAKEIRAKPIPAGIAVKIIAIDGHGGAGKTTFAKRLAAELDGAPIIQTDDFASWENPLNWWPALIEKALKPLAAGKPARFTPTNWGGPEKAPLIIPPAEFVILEGVSASRKAFRSFLTYSIWVDAPRDLRLSRGLDRDHQARISQGLEPDPEEARANWKQWMDEEDGYVARERPQEHVDETIPGDEDLWR